MHTSFLDLFTYTCQSKVENHWW